jgi:hypothetical protein
MSSLNGYSGQPCNIEHCFPCAPIALRFRPAEYEWHRPPFLTVLLEDGGVHHGNMYEKTGSCDTFLNQYDTECLKIFFTDCEE